MTQQSNTYTNQQVVAMATYLLEGATKPVDIEDIAIKAFEISPTKFGWRKYPDRIDLRVVQYALKDASVSSKSPPLLSGSLKHGYLLTPLGIEWAETAYLENKDISDRNRRHSIIEKLSLENARLLTTTAFTKFEAGEVEAITVADFQEFVRINEYFPDQIRRQRYAVIENSVKGSPLLERLWSYLLDNYVNKEVR